MVVWEPTTLIVLTLHIRNVTIEIRVPEMTLKSVYYETGGKLQWM